jgi:hypothetical protein
MGYFPALDFATTLEAMAQRENDGIGDPEKGPQRVFRVLLIAFPTVCFSGIGYTLLIDKVFGLPTALARNIVPKRLHVVAGVVFRCTVPFAWALLHTLLFATCFDIGWPIDELCQHDPLARRWCVVSCVATAMLLAVGEWLERSVLHFSGLRRKTSFWVRGMSYASICVAWLALADRDGMAILLLGFLSVRKMRWAPIGRHGHTAVGVYVRSLKLLIFVTGFLGVRKLCPTISQKHGVGATLVILVS